MKKFKTRTIIRYAFVATIILLFSAMIVAEVFDTTVRHRTEWKFKTDSLLSIKSEIKPIRGDILACDGSVLATNVTYYTVRIDFRSEQLNDKDYANSIGLMADSLSKHFGGDKDYWTNHLLKPLSKPKFKRSRSYPLIKNISYSDYLKIRTFPYLNNPYKNVCGIKLEEEVRRSNPYGKMALRSVGTLTEDTTGERHGYCGLEKDLDSLLYGKAGVSRIVPVNKNTINWVDTPAVNGYTIKTTIDIKMQDIVEHELEKALVKSQADWGVAILMDVETGDIKAITNLELNLSQTAYIEGMNRAVRGFEPSSVVKPLSMLFALENGWAPNLNRVIETGSKYYYGDSKKDPIKDSGFAPSMPIWEIIERSSNIGITKLIIPHIKDPADFKNYLKSIGFLDPMDLHIAGAQVPKFPIPEDGAMINVSRSLFGYASEIPPIYTLSFYNAIANNGRYVRPRFVTNIIDNNGNDSVIPVSYIRERIGSEKNIKILQEMLNRVVWGDHGTAKNFLRSDIVKIAGKTGTGFSIIERVNPKTKELITHDMYGRPLPQEKGRYSTSRKRLSFCGYFPADNPKYSCFVMVFYPKDGNGAAATSGVVLREIALKMYSRGMLNNESNFKDSKSQQNTPTLYATTNTARYGNIKEAFNIKNIKRISNTSSSSGVPNVLGMGIREAVVAIERAGYNVEFEGSGYVNEQFPEGGAQVKKGERIKLKLTNI